MSARGSTRTLGLEMRMVRLKSFWLVVLLISGCAVYPSTRTYYEPNSEDGTPTRSASCGYHAAANDSLERQVGGVSIGVSPHYKKGSNLSLTVSFHYDEDHIDIDKNLIMVTVNGGHSYSPMNIVVNSYEKDNTHPNRIFIHLSYSVLSEDVTELSVALPNLASHELKPFRFKITTKSDIYYASINC